MRWFFLSSYLVCLFLVPLGLKRRASRALSETEEFLTLLRRIKREIACFARPLPEICRTADLPALRAAGFFDAFEGGDLLSAYRRTLPALSLSPEAARLLDGFFSGAGAPLKSEELAACECAISELSELLEHEKNERTVKVRLRSTLILTGGLLFLLLIV